MWFLLFGWSGYICPDWGNNAQAYLAGLGSIGLNNTKMFTVYSIQ